MDKWKNCIGEKNLENIIFLYVKILKEIEIFYMYCELI